MAIEAFELLFQYAKVTATRHSTSIVAVEAEGEELIKIADLLRKGPQTPATEAQACVASLAAGRPSRRSRWARGGDQYPRREWRDTGDNRTRARVADRSLPPQRQAARDRQVQR
jgi:hypothetical protein